MATGEGISGTDRPRGALWPGGRQEEEEDLGVGPVEMESTCSQGSVYYCAQSVAGDTRSAAGGVPEPTRRLSEPLTGSPDVACRF